jgi:dihydrofolate synthase/folylpolyglutamate synthase
VSAVASIADPILDRLKVLHPKAIDLSLDRVWHLMAALGHPERRLPPVIHVAGTNGKGSTVAALRAILEAAGLRAHVYTSPHLVRFSERIRLAGSLIDEPQLAALLEEIEQRNSGAPITFFEVTTAAAFLAFARTPADVTLIETGMGGRLDATNIIDRPLAAVITPISFDHMQFLGTTLPEIAGEKAGILKADVPAVIGAQPQAAFDVLTRRAGELRARPFRRGAEWEIEPAGDGFVYRGRRRYELPGPSLPGRHQIDNAALAIATLDHIDQLLVTEDHMRAGLGRIEWPARLQRLTKGPLIGLLPRGGELFLDGGHNEAAGEILADWAQAQRDKPLDLVFGMLSTKSPEAFLAHMTPYVRRLVAVPIPAEAAALPADAVADAARRAGLSDVAAATSVREAVAQLGRDSGAAPRILICGSLYLAGQVLAENG